jgi:hypothetical protein
MQLERETPTGFRFCGVSLRHRNVDDEWRIHHFPKENSIMSNPKQIKAYVLNAEGQLVPLDTDSVVLEFPSGDTLEVSWETQHPDNPHPVSMVVWGGRRVPIAKSDEPFELPTWTTSVAMVAAAANVMLVHPFSFPVRTCPDEC